MPTSASRRPEATSTAVVRSRNGLWVPNAVDDRMFDRSRIGPDPITNVSRPRLLMIGSFPTSGSMSTCCER